MCHLRQKLRIILFHEKIMFWFQDAQIFVFLPFPHPMIYEICDIMMNIGT